MTEEQFEALKAWLLSATTMPAPGEDVQSRYDAAERRAREAFCGKTWEQPK